MKPIRFSLLIFILLTLLFAEKKSITILKVGDEESTVPTKLRELLTPRFDVKLFNVTNKSAFREAEEKLQTNLIILATPEVSELYRSYNSYAKTIPPILAVSLDSFTRQEIVNISPVQASSEAFRELERLYKKDIPEVAIIYDEVFAKEAEAEQLFLEKNGIKSKPFLFPIEINSVDRVQALKKLTAKGFRHIRFILTDESTAPFVKQPQLRILIQSSISTIICNRELLWKDAYPEIAIVSLRDNDAFMASVIGLMSGVILEGGLPENLKSLMVNATIASLSMGTIQHFTLGDCGRYTNESVKLLLSTEERRINWDDMEEFFGLCIAQGYSGVEKPVFQGEELGQNVVEEKAVEVVRTLFNNQYYSIVVSFLLGLLVVFFIIYKIAKNIRDSRLINRSVLFFPQELKKETLMYESKSVALSAVFNKNGYSPLFTSSTIQMQQMIRHYMPDIFVIDFRETKAVNYLRKELSGYSLSSAETVILFNIPIAYQVEAKEAFGRAVCLCFEEVPEIDQLVEALNKKGGNEAEFSGRIKKDSLASMLQMLETQQSSGCLVIEDDSPLTVIYYKQGAIIHAEDRIGNRGEEAIYTGLRCKRGRFQFLSDRQAPMMTTHFSAMEILLSFAERSDTENRHH